MSDAITFNCGSCGKSYRVALSYAGREFACKSCGTRLTVPQQGQAPIQIEPRVELGSGGEVMRATPSGRRVAADPTRVFVKQRETSNRMAAVGSGEESAKRSGKGPLIAVAVIVVLLGGSLGGAWAAGLFGGSASAGGTAPQDGNAPLALPQAAQESERERILKQLDVSGQSSSDLMKLFHRAEDAGLPEVDLVMIGSKVVYAIDAEQGAGYSDADLMAFAVRMEKLNAPMDAATLYGVVVDHNRAKPEKSPQYDAAHAGLGHHRLDFAPALSAAAELRDSKLVEGMDKLYDELVAMEGRADEGWVALSDKTRFEQVAKLLDDGRAEFDRIMREEPWRVKVGEAERFFRLEKAAGIGKWETFWRDPYVIFVQLQGEEDRAGAEQRLGRALACASAFPAFFEEEFRKPLELKRTLPDSLSQAERDEAPIVVKLFKDASYWQAYMRDKGYKDFDAVKARTATEPGTGHVSMVYSDEQTSLGPFIRALIDVVMYNHHPRAPRTLEEDKEFRSYNAWFLEVFLHQAISITAARGTGINTEYSFLINDDRATKMLKQWKQPFARDSQERVVSFGASLMSMRDFLESRKPEELDERTRLALKGCKDLTEGDMILYGDPRQLRAIGGYYFRGLFTFLFHWGPDGTPKYREKLLKFIQMDLNGEVDKENPVPAFEKAFGLDAAGWKQFDADWDTYQSQ